MTPPEVVPRHVDGNAVAGPMAEVFGTDMSDAMGTCSGCGARAAMAQAHAYADGPGVVLRCHGCEGILMRWTTTPARIWLQMPGLVSLEIGVRS